MRKQTDGNKGQSLLELALLLPVLLIILAGVIDLGRLYYVHVAITDAAAEGAAYAATHPPEDEESKSEIRARAQAASHGLVEIESADQIEIDCVSTASGETVTVSVHYDFKIMMPFINIIVSDGVLPLEATASEAILAGVLSTP